jgi:hypothetical protein
MSYIGGFRICMHTIIQTTETVQSASCSPQHPICDSGNALHRSMPAPALHLAHFCGAARGGRQGLDPVGVPRTLFHHRGVKSPYATSSTVTTLGLGVTTNLPCHCVVMVSSTT